MVFLNENFKDLRDHGERPNGLLLWNTSEPSPYDIIEILLGTGLFFNLRHKPDPLFGSPHFNLVKTSVCFLTNIHHFHDDDDDTSD